LFKTLSPTYFDRTKTGNLRQSIQTNKIKTKKNLIDSVVSYTNMKFFFAFLATLFLAAPAWAVDVQMGSGGNLIFDPADVTISAGESVHFINNMLPPHNVVVEDHPEISHEALAMMPGEEFDITFTEAGDYTYWCGPHKGAGMIGTVHVN
jgi:plastocyanin